MSAQATTRHRGVASRTSPGGGSALPGSNRSDSQRYVHSLGWLLRGDRRLTAVPLQLRPYRGPENRSQFGSRQNSPLQVVRGGR